MKKIAVLIDFTESSKPALEQARVVAEATGGELYAVHMSADSSPQPGLEEKITAAVQGVVGAEIPVKPVVGHGDLLGNAAFVISHINPDLVVVCTHGIKGIKQHLFGAHILKLVQSIPYPCLVVQENTRVSPSGIKRILFPVGPHPRYHTKIEQTAKLAHVFGSEVVQYEIEKYMPDSREAIMRNMMDARSSFELHHIPYTSVLDDSPVVSLGYSRPTLRWAANNQIDMISIMSHIPDNEIYIGRADKETILTNEDGIPVLCCNQ